MNNSIDAIQPNDRVQIRYTTRSLEGSVIETSDRRDALEFHAGDESVIPGVSHAVIGMRLGESRTVTAPPERAFGRHNPDLIQSTPRSSVPVDTQVGDQLSTTFGNSRFDVWVQRITSTEAIVDANHPLAGETLVIDLTIVGHDPA